MTHFIVIYNRTTGESRVEQFDGPDSADDALAARFRAEREGLGDEFEVASLAADDLDELKATHSRYFQGASEMLDDIERLIAF